MENEYYKNYYFFERNHWWFKARNGIILKYIRSNILINDKLKILNIGAATGGSSEMLNILGDLISIEYNQDCIDFVKDKLSLSISKGDILNLNFPEDYFDLVCAFDVIEHVEDDQKAVNEILRVCKTGGNIILTVPAFMSLWSEHDEINHHFRRYKMENILDLLDKEMLSIEYKTYFNSILFPLIFFQRKISNLRKKNQKSNALKSDFEVFNPKIINNLFFYLFSLESHCIIRKIPLPFGVSILINFKKLKC